MAEAQVRHWSHVIITAMDIDKSLEFYRQAVDAQIFSDHTIDDEDFGVWSVCRGPGRGSSTWSSAAKISS